MVMIYQYTFINYKTLLLLTFLTTSLGGRIDIIISILQMKKQLRKVLFNPKLVNDKATIQTRIF